MLSELEANPRESPAKQSEAPMSEKWLGYPPRMGARFVRFRLPSKFKRRAYTPEDGRSVYNSVECIVLENVLEPQGRLR